MKSKVNGITSNTNFGNNLHDEVLQYQLDNEVVASIIRTDPTGTPDATTTQIVFYNKKGIELGRTAPITIDSVGNKVVKKLELIDQPLLNSGKLRITFKGKESPEDTGFIDCPLDDLYVKIKTNTDNIAQNTAAILTKQDKLVSGSNIKTVGGNSILGSGDIAFPATGVTKIVAGDGLTGGTVTSEGTIAVDYTKVATVQNLNKKQDKLTAGENITITADNVISSAGGTGSVIYAEYDTIKLDEVENSGVYKILNATDSPVSETEGILNVTSLSNPTYEKVKQEWFTNNSHSIRLMNKGQVERNIFKVNGVEVAQGTVTLSAGNVYTLEGDLIGNVKVTGMPEHQITRLILKGVNILSSELTAIDFSSVAESGGYKNVIELYADSNNYLKVNTNLAPVGDEDPGTLNAEDDLFITGTGYLTIENNRCHAIRGSKLKINSDPHITIIDCAHDGIHGGKELFISGGHFKILNAGVDAVSHSGGSAKNGCMAITGGKFDIKACGESAFQSKTTTGFKKIICEADITVANTISTAVTNVDIYDNIIWNYSGSQQITKKSLEYDFATSATVRFFDLDGSFVENVTPVDGKFTLTKSDSDGYYVASGNFGGSLFSWNTITSTVKKPKLQLNGVYFSDSTGTVPFISYPQDGKNIAVDLVENTFNWIYSANSNCIYSENNLQLGGSDGVLCLRSENNTAIYAPAGDIILKGDGITYIYKSAVGCVTNILWVSPEADKTTKVNGIVQFSNNELDAYLPTKYSSSLGRNDAGHMISTERLTSGVLINSITDKGENPNGLTDLDGYIEATFNSSDYKNKPSIVLKNSATTISDLRNVQIAMRDTEWADENIPDLEPDQGKGGWITYNFGTIQSTLDNHETRITALEQGGGGLNPSIDDTGDLKLSNVSVDANNDVNLGNKAQYIDETNDVKLK